MAPTTHRPNYDFPISESTTSIATTPVVASAIAPCSGYLQRVMAGAGGTTTGTIAVAVSINNGADITGGKLTIAAGSNARAGSVLEFPLSGSSAIWVNEGDVITWTPSGGTGASIPGAFGAVIRAV